VGVPGATDPRHDEHRPVLQPLAGAAHARRIDPQKPFSIKTAQENSAYWLATQEKVANVAAFFTTLKSFRLEDAPGGRI